MSPSPDEAYLLPQKAQRRCFILKKAILRGLQGVRETDIVKILIIFEMIFVQQKTLFGDHSRNFLTKTEFRRKTPVVKFRSYLISKTKQLFRNFAKPRSVGVELSFLFSHSSPPSMSGIFAPTTFWGKTVLRNC